MDGNYSNPNNPAYDGLIHTFGVSGYPTVSFKIVGTITTGNYTPQVSDDGDAWYPITAQAADGTVLNTVNAAGLYRCDVNGYQVWRLNPSAGIVANCSVSSVASPMAL